MSAHVAGKGLSLALPDFILQRAISLVGGPMGDPRNVAPFFDDFWGSVVGNPISPGWRQPAPAGTGAGSFVVAGGAGGVHQLTTGATAASSISNVTDSPAIFTVSGAPWYCAHRSKITTAVDAQAIVYGGLQNSAANKTLAAGFFGALSAANFVVQYDGNEAGSFVDLGVAVDTAFHIFEMWGVGDGKIHCAIDYGADKGGAAMAAAPADYCYAIRMIKNGATAAARTVVGDWFAMVAKRT
jgi:hypothetical protein